MMSTACSLRLDTWHRRWCSKCRSRKDLWRNQQRRTLQISHPLAYISGQKWNRLGKNSLFSTPNPGDSNLEYWTRNAQQTYTEVCISENWKHWRKIERNNHSKLASYGHSTSQKSEFPFSSIRSSPMVSYFHFQINTVYKREQIKEKAYYSI